MSEEFDPVVHQFLNEAHHAAYDLLAEWKSKGYTINKAAAISAIALGYLESMQEMDTDWEQERSMNEHIRESARTSGALLFGDVKGEA